MLEKIFYIVGGLVIIGSMLLFSITLLYCTHLLIKKATTRYWAFAIMCYKLNKMDYKERAVLNIVYIGIIKKDERSKKYIEDMYDLLNK